MMDFSDPQRHPDGMSHPKQAAIPELGSVVDALPGLVWTALPDGRVDFVNHQWREYTGVSSLHSSGDAWQMAIHPEDLPRLLECLRSSISSRNPCEAEVRMRRFDGQFRWFAVRANPITDGSGAVVKYCGFNWDIEDRKRGDELVGFTADVTRRKHVEEELRRTAAFLAQAQHVSSTGSFWWHVSTTDEITWSEELYRIF